MHSAQLFVALLVPLVLLALLARQSARVPEPVALVAGGIAVGLLPFAPDVALEPDVIFAVFLPPILYPSAFTFASEDLRVALRPVAWPAVGLVPATMLVIAVVGHLVGGLAWAPAFVLGAVLAPTDPVAATSVIRSGGAPPRLAVLLEGESLVNDGTALTALKLALAAVGGSFAALHGAAEFLKIAGGGIVVGAALAWATTYARRRLDDVELGTALAVLLAYGAFLLAERIGVSGVLATVAAGVVMGRRGHLASADARLGGRSFWTVTQFLAESMLFLLVGLAFAHVLADPASRPLLELAGITGAVVAAAVGARLAWMFTMPYVAVRLSRSADEVAVGARERVVLGAAGLRGAVSVAAALSIPPTVSGSPFPDRTTVVSVAIATIVVTLVVPALGLPALLRRLGLLETAAAGDEERRARAVLAEAALDRLERMDGDAAADVLDRTRAVYERRLERARGEDDGEGRDGDAARELRRAAVRAERDALRRLRREGALHGEVLRDLAHELDQEEARLR